MLKEKPSPNILLSDKCKIKTNLYTISNSYENNSEDYSYLLTDILLHMYLHKLLSGGDARSGNSCGLGMEKLEIAFNVGFLSFYFLAVWIFH